MAKRESQRMTVAGLAKRLGLSRATVSLVLNDRGKSHRISRVTILRVKAAARRYDYHPNLVARQLAGKRSNAVGVLISTEAVADVRFIQAMEVLAAKRGLRFIIGHALGTPRQVKEYLADFRDRGVDGLISIFHNHPDFRDIVLPELAGFRNVVYYERPDHADRAAVASAWYIEPDYYRVGQLGVRHLLDLGRWPVGLVLNNRAFSYAVHRSRAYTDTMRAAGYTRPGELIWVMSEQPGLRWTEPFTDELALMAVDDLVVRHEVNGLVAVNDLYAAQLIRALRRRGRRVPADVAVVGCDNLEFGPAIEPALTTIDLHGADLARAMMELVFARLEGKKLPRKKHQRVIQPDLVVRDST